MSNFITNSGVFNLKKRISDLIEISEEVKFLVGFFYFSGIRELYDSIKSNKDLEIKVLVGLNVDKINNQLIDYVVQNEESLSDNEKVDEFLNSLKKSINSDFFDNEELYNQILFFIQLIKAGRLKIRKTFQPNHAKLYIFKLKPKQAKELLFITGSSNLTKPGLDFQNEFNIEVSDYGVKEAEDYFDKLWKTSIPITEKKEYQEKVINTLENKTFLKKITPFEAYLLALKIYIESFGKENVPQLILKLLKKNNYFIYQYQLDAIGQALSTIKKYNGVILADVVGLGKSIIACCVAKTLNKRGIIICPPNLIGNKDKKDMGWEMYKDQFQLYDWEVWSLGKLEELYDQLKSRLKDVEVIIVDEAHRFRNQDTKNYSIIKNICRGKKVILLTATPFNNSPADILSLLSLFITPKKSTLTLSNNLVNKFRIFQGIFDRLSFIKKNILSIDKNKKNKACRYYQGLFGEEFDERNKYIGFEKIKERARYLSKQIKNVLEEVTIRRNRLDLKENPDYKDEVKNLSEVEDPQEWFYQLTKEQLDFYEKVINEYFANPEDGGLFKGAIYRPFEYEIERNLNLENKLTLQENREFIQQRNLYDFMRRLLVKRFESSFGSFKKSIENFYRITDNALIFIKKTGKFILDRDLIEGIYDKDIETIEEILKEYSQKILDGVYPKNHKIYHINKFNQKDKFLKDIESDLNLFKKILEEIEKLKLIDNDPKATELIFRIKNSLEKEQKRKIIVFSEYVDTVDYLANILGKVFKDRLLTVSKDLTKEKCEKIKENFDASSIIIKNDYDILLTSDKLSEGFNLNRAGLVINYDIPWNPVRVIQRLGRINRISKKLFDKLYIANFFPTEKGATLVKSKEIAAGKMFLIHKALGEDSKIFEPDEEPEPSKLYSKINQNPERLEQENFYTKIYKEYLQLKKDYSKFFESFKDFPLRVKVAKKSNEQEIILFIKKGKLFILYKKYQEKEKIKELTFEDVWEKIKCDVNTKRLELSDNFWDFYYQMKSYNDEKLFIENVNSLEKQARNNLKTLLSIDDNDNLNQLKKFIRVLLEDIEDYGTLPDYTLREIANLESIEKNNLEKTIQQLKKIKDNLGDDYLNKERSKKFDLEKQIIVAVENQK